MWGNLLKASSRRRVWKGWASFLGGELGSKYALKYRTSFGFFLFGFIILSFLIRLHYWFTIFIFLNCHFFLFFGWHIRFRFVGTIVLYTAYTVLITFTFVLIFVLIKSILLFKKFFLLVFTINFLIASQKSWYYWISPWIKPIKVILTSYVCTYYYSK